MTLLIVGLVLLTLNITGVGHLWSQAGLMFAAPALALSPVRPAGANSPPPHLTRWVRLLRAVQITCLVVGFGLGATQLFGSTNFVAAKIAALLFMASLVLTLVFAATTWPAARPEPQL